MQNVELGIILKTDKSKEYDVVCKILTPKSLKTAYAIGVLKPTAKLKNAVQLFSICEFTFAGHKITGANVVQSPMPIAKCMNRYYLASSIAEVILQIQNHDAEIFTITARALEALTGDTSAYIIFIDYFKKLLFSLGYSVDIQNVDGNLTLSTAKEYIKQLIACYKTLLDIVIPNTDLFLSSPANPL